MVSFPRSSGDPLNDSRDPHLDRDHGVGDHWNRGKEGVWECLDGKGISKPQDTHFFFNKNTKIPRKTWNPASRKIEHILLYLSVKHVNGANLGFHSLAFISEFASE